MASASDHRAHAALQPADCLILLPQRLPAAVETSIGPAHYPAECTQSDAFLQPSLRARKGRANSNSFQDNEQGWRKRAAIWWDGIFCRLSRYRCAESEVFLSRNSSPR